MVFFLLNHDARVFDLHLLDRVDHLVPLMVDVHAHRAQLFDELFDLTLSGISPHIANVLVGFSSEDLVDGSRHAVGDSHLRFIGRAQTKFKCVVFGSVERAALFGCPLRGLDEDFS